MPPEGVTIEEVAAAMTKIVSEGNTPSVRSVRKITKKGSHDTLSKRMAKVRMLQVAENIQDNDDMPQDVTELFNDISRLVWQSSKRIADEKVQSLSQQVHERAYAFSEVIDAIQVLTEQATTHMEDLHNISDLKHDESDR